MMADVSVKEWTVYRTRELSRIDLNGTPIAKEAKAVIEKEVEVEIRGLGKFYRKNKAIRQLRQDPARVTTKMWLVTSVTGGNDSPASMATE
jgi:hypothetical protein